MRNTLAVLLLITCCLGSGHAWAKQKAVPASSYDPAATTDAELDYIVYAAYIAARDVALANDNYFANENSGEEELQEAMQEALEREGYPGVNIVMGVRTPQETRFCASPRETDLRVHVGADGIGFSIAAVTSRRASAYVYNPSKSADISETPATACTPS